ncbi:MAG: polymer-forming cytoskeletal protein [Gemmatimonadaceae bacterium]
MAIFGKDTNGAEEPKGGNNGLQGEGSLSIIAPGMKVTGDVETDGVVKIEGRIEGNVRGGRQVLVGRQGSVQGDITTREAVIGGRVQGTISASERIEVQSTSVIVGNIDTKSIAVMEGGKINGAVRINDAVQTPARQSDANKAQPVAVVR